MTDFLYLKSAMSKTQTALEVIISIVLDSIHSVNLYIDFSKRWGSILKTKNKNINIAKIQSTSMYSHVKYTCWVSMRSLQIVKHTCIIHGKGRPRSVQQHKSSLGVFWVQNKKTKQVVNPFWVIFLSYVPADHACACTKILLT